MRSSTMIPRRRHRTGQAVGRGVALSLLVVVGATLLRPGPPRPPATATDIAQIEAYRICTP
jgi:hypothetical protein